MIRVAHIITGLDGGGAEFMLARLVSAMPATEFEHHVISLTGDGIVGALLRQHGVPVHLLEIRKNIAALGSNARLRTCLRDISPSIVQTWLCHADLMGGLAARFSARLPVVWGVHQSDNGAQSSWSTRLVLAACARLSSHIPQRVIFCSESARQSRVVAGFPPERCEVIANAVEATEFTRNEQEGRAIRDQLGIPRDALVIAYPARWHVDKDPRNFFSAAALILAERPDVQFLLFGTGLDASNIALMDALREVENQEAFHLLGFRTDVVALMSASDMGLLSSRTEALPNVIMEGMSCGLPFVATDVGDVATLIGDAGTVVPARDPQSLATAVLAIATSDARQLGQLSAQARRRIGEHYSLARSADRYAHVYREVLGEVA